MVGPRLRDEGRRVRLLPLYPVRVHRWHHVVTAHRVVTVPVLKAKFVQINCLTNKFRILSPPTIVSFSGPQNRETKEGNATIGGGLKQLDEIGDYIQIVLISSVKMKQREEIEDLSHN